MMNLSLKSKVTLFVALIVILVSAVSTFLFISAQTRDLEREIMARGVTMAESLSRAVEEGLASENLELIKQVGNIVHTKDVVFAQVYSSLWLAVDAYPLEQLNEPPDPAAVRHFETSDEPFYSKGPSWYEFYTPVLYQPSSVDVLKNGRIVIGYVRLRLSTAEAVGTIQRTVLVNLAVSALLTALAVVLLNAFLRTYVLKPILNLQAAVSRHKEGEFPESVPVYTTDEIGNLSSEFNQMGRALKEREERLAEEKERLAVTLRSIGDGVIVTDVNGAVTLINKVAEELTGWQGRDAAGRPLHEIFRIVDEKTREPREHPVDKVIATGLICGLANHTLLIRKDGTELVIEDSAAPVRDRASRIIGVVLVFRDSTEKRLIEKELLKVDKLESVGVLAGGLAHDFNNLLTAVLGNISMAKIYVDAGSKAFARLNEAESASRRAAELTYQLLTFSRGGTPVRKAASLCDLIREAAGFTLSGTNVAAEFTLNSGLWPVDVDSGQISQVFNNLIINAVQAMPGGGTIVLAAENVVLGESDVPTLKAGTYVRITVADRGAGIPPEHLPRVFDPYFTTKQNGRGLGLASVYSIVKKHDGHITVKSKVSDGTTFHIYLAVSGGLSAARSSVPGALVRGRGRVLVMDDEKFVRDISGELLRELGYDVAFALHGVEAVTLYQEASEAGKPFHAVIMDLTIPGGMGGKETLARLLALDPEVKAIVASGYSNDPVMADYKKYGFKGVIIKPYSIDAFSQTLREVLQ